MNPANRFALLKFARLEIGPEQLRRLGWLDWTFDTDSGDLSVQVPPDLGEPVEVTAGDVAAALEQSVQSGTSAMDLQQWAGLLILCDAFVLREGEREVVSQVLHSIASPELFGPLTADRVRELRGMLH